jgi:Cu2+-containing amine oxidase
VKDDARVQEAMRRRGVTDMSMLMVDAWCSGYYTEEDHPRRRLSRPLLFVRTGDGQDNGYARPVEGLQLVVDHSTFTVRILVSLSSVAPATHSQRRAFCEPPPPASSNRSVSGATSCRQAALHSHAHEVGTTRVQVVAFEDRGDDHAPLPPPDPMRNFHTPPTLPPAVPLKPISITQPDGPSWHLVRVSSHVYGVGQHVLLPRPRSTES